ncbi:ATP-binding protein [Streptomyces sp. NPDC021020]|uniref:ATP-binding protein n=1 Tax=Streptomyces sp. NPDC021020 TaxID=3365109 RepID=UPI0037A983D5
MTACAPGPGADGNPPLVVEKSWPHGPRSAGRARRLLVSSLDTWSLPHLADDAALVVSELVSNSVQHAREPRGHVIRTRFERLDAAVRIEVHDANPGAPAPRTPTPDDESGRGLALVDSITAGRWGVSEREGIGKMVWAVCTDGRA